MYARLFNLKADPIHTLQLLIRQIDDEARREVLEDVREGEGRKGREEELRLGVWGWWIGVHRCRGSVRSEGWWW